MPTAAGELDLLRKRGAMSESVRAQHQRRTSFPCVTTMRKFAYSCSSIVKLLERGVVALTGNRGRWGDPRKMERPRLRGKGNVEKEYH